MFGIMNMRKYFLTGVCVVAICCTATAIAETTSSIRYEQGRDDIEGDSRYLDIDLGLQSNNHIVLGYGNSTSQTDTETLESDAYYIGMLTDPYADTATGITYTALKEENSFDLDSIRLDLIANTDDWGFLLSPELRNIDIFATSTTSTSGQGPGNVVTSVSDATISTLSPALGAVASYYGIDHIYIRAGITVFSYEKDVTALSNRTAFSMRNTSVSTLDQAYGLEDYRALFAAGYNYGAGNIGLRYTRSVSIIDEATTRTNSFYISYKFNDTWRTELTTGRVDDGISESKFVSAALGYHW